MEVGGQLQAPTPLSKARPPVPIGQEMVVLETVCFIVLCTVLLLKFIETRLTKNVHQYTTRPYPEKAYFSAYLSRLDPHLSVTEASPSTKKLPE